LNLSENESSQGVNGRGAAVSINDLERFDGYLPIIRSSLDMERVRRNVKNQFGAGT
jgi:hypothetical protein